MESTHVRQAITAAFGALPVPPPKRLIRPLSTRDRVGEEGIRRALAGKTWQSFPPGFFHSRWAAFCYLSPEGYRYYLPALLTGALDELNESSSLAHSVVFSLRPSFWALYYEGEDQDFIARQSRFTPEQYRAVTEFLRFVMEQVPGLQYLAAQAIRWGWGRLDTPASLAAQQYYQRLHNFTYPEPADPAVVGLVEEIRSAFAARPYPGDLDLCGSRQGGEPAEYAMEFRGVRWQSLHPEFLAQNYAALSFLTDAGFCHFLPAFLISDLHGYESNADPVFHLTHGLDGDPDVPFVSVVNDLTEVLGPETVQVLQQVGEVDWRAHSVRRFGSFTRPERRAIIRYLEYRAANDAFDRPTIRLALESYWLPSLN